MEGRNRFLNLIHEGMENEINKCLYHNTTEEEFSILHPHVCPRSFLPERTKLILKDHTDEVWIVKFSHNGKYLASGSKDKSIIIWEVNENVRTFSFF